MPHCHLSPSLLDERQQQLMEADTLHTSLEVVAEDVVEVDLMLAPSVVGVGNVVDVEMKVEQ